MAKLASTQLDRMHTYLDPKIEVIMDFIKLSVVEGDFLQWVIHFFTRM